MSMTRSVGINSARNVGGECSDNLEAHVGITSNADRYQCLVQDPELDRAIGYAVYDCIGKLNATLAPPPEAIVLTGSFARGEGSVLGKGNRLKVLGDIEFMVFFQPKADLGYLQTVLTERAFELERRLQGASIDCKLEFSAVSTRYLTKLQPHIFAYELLRHGRIICGRNVLSAARHFEAVAIPKWDAWRMLNNRMVEQLEPAGVLGHGGRPQLHQVFYQVAKCYLDTATTLLIFGGRYFDTYAKRASELRTWASEPDRPKELFWLPVVAERVGACTSFKL